MNRDLRTTIGTQICLLAFIAGSVAHPFDPLPTRLRNVISSNHLGEGTPQFFAEYHALLPNYRGDFGVKSQLVKESSKEPIYAGADTVVVPLYIPPGAIPIEIHERVPRSGKSGSSFRLLGGPSVPGDSVRINRPIAKRIGTPSRRISSGSRKIPTPPPDFITTWMKKRTSELASKSSDNVEAAKRVKIMSHMADFKRKISNRTSNRRLHRTNNAAAGLLTSQTAASVGESIFLKNSSVSQAVSTTPSVVSIPSASRLRLRTQVRTKKRRIRPQIPVPKPTIKTTAEISISAQNSSSTESIKSTEPSISPYPHNATAPNLKTSDFSRIPATKTTTVASPISTTTESSKPTDATSRNTGSSRVPVWPRRRAPLTPKLRKKDTAINDSKSNQNEDIIDRVLNSAAGKPLVSTESLAEENSSKNVSSESLIDKIIANATRHNQQIKAATTETNSTLIRGNNRVKGLPIVSWKPETQLKNDDETSEIKTVNELSTNSITTSTPKLPWSVSKRPSIHRPKSRRQGQVVRTFHIPQSRYNTSGQTSTKTKSPQDIVLEKLSKLMTVSAASGRQNLDVIAREIEIINDELAALNIYIVDAEFDGHKLDLNRKGETLSHTPPTPSTTVEHVSVNLTPKPTIVASQANTSKYTEAIMKFIEAVPQPETTIPSITDTKNTAQSEGTSSIIVPHPVDLRQYAPEKWLGSSILVHSSVTEDTEMTPITPSSVQSSTITTRTRSTLIPVTTKFDDQIMASHPADKTHHQTKNEDANHINRSSHFRPILRNSNTHLSDEVLRPEATTSSIHLAPHTTTYPTTTQEPNPFVDTSSKPIEKSAPILADARNDSSTTINETALLLEIESSSQPELIENQSSSYVYFACLLGVVPFAILLLVFWKSRFKSRRKSLPEREERSEVNSPPIHQVRSSKHAGTLDALPAYVFEHSENRSSRWELARSKLRITGVIGEGNFGIVWKAEARNICEWERGGGPTVLVAVKGVKENASAKEKSDLLRELSIMKILGQHSNIVTLLGCCTTHASYHLISKGSRSSNAAVPFPVLMKLEWKMLGDFVLAEPYYLVMEYVMFGKLLTFLRESRTKNNYFNFSSDTEHLTSKDLTRFAQQIATGCDYLQSKGIIHRDLAARNILVDHNKLCKIADFGLARSVKDLDSDIYEQKSRGPLPIRWMALESLYMNIFTHKSDVWSFGILCWEIVTLGSTPYPGISAREVMRRVQEGYRLECPEHCRPEFYRIIASCWNQDLNKRPTFTTLRCELRELLDQKEGWIDLENFQESTYYSMHENNEEKL